MIGNFFKEKTVEEIKEKKIKKVERLYDLKDLTEEEKECFYYAQLNFPQKNIDKQLLNVTKHIAKIMAKKELDTDEVIIAQNFAIMGYLSSLCEKNK